MKNKKFNRNAMLVAILFLLLIFSIGCSKFLDRKPLGQAINGNISGGGAQAATFGLYSSLQNWGMTGLAFLTMHAARADDDLNSTPGDGTDQQAIVDNFQYTKSHWSLDQLWDNHMAFVQQATGIIHDIDSAYATDPSSIQNEGECKFLRAYAYFDLVRDYGQVPLIRNKVYVANDANVAKANSISEVYAFIDSDLVYAAQHLPPSWSTQYLGRVTSGSANALLAKSYLYQGQWDNALASAEAVINSGLYSLDPSYEHLFSEAGENGSESLFEIQNYLNSNGSVNLSNGLPGYQGVRAAGEWNLGWGWNLPDTGLVMNAYETGDQRKGTTIFQSGEPDNYFGGVSYSATLPPNPNVAWWTKKIYGDPARRQSTGDLYSDWLHTYILRYADVLLIAAEADNESAGASDSTKIKGWVNTVRERAGLPDISYVSQSAMRTAIKKERRVEFAMEFERFYDLVRWTPATDGIDAPHVLGRLGYVPINALYPIPQEAIDKSNGTLVQNPNYP
jgi:starch-binding outer membrane protein, SusD/RagB family